MSLFGDSASLKDKDADVCDTSLSSLPDDSPETIANTARFLFFMTDEFPSSDDEFEMSNEPERLNDVWQLNDDSIADEPIE